MNMLPAIAPRQFLRYWWDYRNEEGKPIAIVARYDAPGTKKKFHQFLLSENGQWTEGAATPSPLYGLDTLSKTHCADKVYIFEGEKCATAAHYLNLPALTSMMGANQAHHADWAVLAKYRHIKEFVLIPDNDDAGQKYMKAIFDDIQKACPHAKISVCPLSVKNKGDDFVDWLQSQTQCPSNWNGFNVIEEPYTTDLRLIFESYVAQCGIEAKQYFEQSETDGPSFECDPEPIEKALCDVLPPPLTTLPKEIIGWIQGLALQMQISEDYLVVPLLVYVGSLIGRKRGLQLRIGSDWKEYPNLWGMLVGRPSMMKSPAMKAVQRPLLKLIENASREHEEALQQHEIDCEAWTLRKKARDEVYKKKIKETLENNKTSNSNYQSETQSLKPKKRRYKTEDSTTQKLAELLIENPQGLLLFRDELSGWLNSFDKTGGENDRQFYLESWSGNQEFEVDRISRGSLHVPALCLSIFGSIQPGPLSQYIHSALKGGIGDDGFIQRFQVMVWPDAKPSWELFEGIDVNELIIPIHKIFDCLDRLTLNPIGEPVILAFSAEAQQLFDQWQHNFENRIRSGNLASHMEAHLTKYKKLLPALCLILEHLKHALFDSHPSHITVETLKDSINWLEYFESHANRIYGSSSNAISKAANDLIKCIQKGEIKESFTARDIYQGKHWSGLANAEQVNEVLEYLEEKHYVIGKQVKTAGRPMKRYWSNPKIFVSSESQHAHEEAFEPFGPSNSYENQFFAVNNI